MPQCSVLRYTLQATINRTDRWPCNDVCRREDTRCGRVETEVVAAGHCDGTGIPQNRMPGIAAASQSPHQLQSRDARTLPVMLGFQVFEDDFPRVHPQPGRP